MYQAFSLMSNKWNLEEDEEEEQSLKLALDMKP